MTPARFSSARKVVATRDAVEHRVDRDLARALDAGEHLLLLDRDAELLVDAQDFGIDLVERAELRLRLGLGIIISVLEIDRRDVELGPAHLLHGQPGAIGLEPPFEHPFGLVLLGRDEADRVLAQALGREILLDVGGEAPFVGRGAVGGVLGFAGCGRRVIAGHAPGEAVEADALASAPRTAPLTTPMCGRTWQAPSSAQSWRSVSTQVVIAIGPSTASTMSARLIAAAGRGEAEAAAGAARRFEQAGGGEPAGQLLRGRQAARRSRRRAGVALSRAPAAMAGGGGHHHDGIIGKAGQAHFANALQSDSIRSDCHVGS